MKIEKVKVNYGKTVSSGVKFEFIRLDVGVEASIDSSDETGNVIRTLKKQCKDICEGMIYKELESIHGR